MRRKAGTLIPIEADILQAARRLQAGGASSFHGHMLATQLQDQTGARQLVAHGTLYKALIRLERAGYLTSAWEDWEQAQREGRRQRRIYWLTTEEDNNGTA